LEADYSQDQSYDWRFDELFERKVQKETRGGKKKKRRQTAAERRDLQVRTRGPNPGIKGWGPIAPILKEEVGRSPLTQKDGTVTSGKKGRGSSRAVHVTALIVRNCRHGTERKRGGLSKKNGLGLHLPRKLQD